MKRITGILFCLAMLIGFAQAAEPIEYECGEFVYTLNAHGNASIVDYNGDAIDLVFPSEVDGHPVTSIFSAPYASNVRTVHIPEGVTVLGYGALSECRDLETVVLPSTLRVIGQWALGCSDVRNINLPENLIIIDDEAFDCCENIISVTYPSSLCYLGEGAFNNHGDFPSLYSVAYSDAIRASRFADLVLDKDRINTCGDYVYEINDDGSVTIVLCTASGDVAVPETLDGHRVTAIGKGAFVLAIDMETLVLPQTVTSIGKEAFRRCDRLTSVVLPEKLTEIGEATFAHCTSLADITLPQSVTVIQDFAFYDCPSLPQLQFPDSLERIERYAFYNCYEDDEIFSVPDQTEIGEEAFSAYKEGYVEPYENWTWYDEETDCEAEEAAWNTDAAPENFQYELNTDGTITIAKYTGESSNVRIPEMIDGREVTTIGNHAFASFWFEQLTFPDTVTVIGDGAFSGCVFDEPLVLPKNLTTIGTASFCNISTDSVTFPDTPVSIGDYAFYHAYIGEYQVIPANVAEIGEWAFAVPEFGDGTFILLCDNVHIEENAFFDAYEMTVPAGSPLVQYCQASGIFCSEILPDDELWSALQP